MSSLLYEYLKADAAKRKWTTILQNTLEYHLSKIFPDVTVYFDPCRNRFVFDLSSHHERSQDRSIPFCDVWYKILYTIQFPDKEQFLPLRRANCGSWFGFFLSDEEAEQVKDILEDVFNLSVD
jgi:hypothetical protein